MGLHTGQLGHGPAYRAARATHAVLGAFCLLTCLAVELVWQMCERIWFGQLLLCSTRASTGSSPAFVHTFNRLWTFRRLTCLDVGLVTG